MEEQYPQDRQSEDGPEIERRRFIQAGLASTGTAIARSLLRGQTAAAEVPPQIITTSVDQIPRRPLGKTGNRYRSSASEDITWEQCNPPR
jgi:hypothetical protein